MHPLFIFSIIALLPSRARGVERTNAAYERVVECFSKGLHADQGTNLPSQTQMCDKFQVRAAFNHVKKSPYSKLIGQVIIWQFFYQVLPSVTLLPRKLRISDFAKCRLRDCVILYFPA